MIGEQAHNYPDDEGQVIAEFLDADGVLLGTVATPLQHVGTGGWVEVTTSAPYRPGARQLRVVAEDATDYVMLPLSFVDTSRTAVISFATKAPTGFSEEEMRALDEASRLLSPYAERALLRRIAIDLLAAYLGRAAGQRVYEGRVERGDVETLEAAIWFCDLRGFTALAEHLPRREVIGLLNRWCGRRSSRDGGRRDPEVHGRRIPRRLPGRRQARYRL